jgi:hypothetical protein
MSDTTSLLNGATVSEIPLISAQQSFTMGLNGTNYTFTFAYRDTMDGGWTMDIADSVGNSIIAGIPLVTGSNLLEQYDYLGILLPGQALFVASDGQEPDAVPTYTNLGADSHLYLYVS